MEQLKLIQNMRETLDLEKIVSATKLEQPYVEEVFGLLDKHLEKNHDEIAEKLLSKTAIKK